MENRGELIPARRGNFLHIDGFLYYKHSQNDEAIYWNCRRKGECRARAVTNHQLNIRKGPANSPHEHAPNPDEVEALKIQSRIKTAALEDPATAPSRILRRELHATPTGTHYSNVRGNVV